MDNQAILNLLIDMRGEIQRNRDTIFQLQKKADAYDVLAKAIHGMTHDHGGGYAMTTDPLWQADATIDQLRDTIRMEDEKAKQAEVDRASKEANEKRAGIVAAAGPLKFTPVS